MKKLKKGNLLEETFFEGNVTFVTFLFPALVTDDLC